MYFYVDESGHTGLNLFDDAQPELMYGLLSTRLNLDVVAEPTLRLLRAKFGVQRLHAAELGMGRLAEAAPTLSRMVSKFDARFDHYRLVKADYAFMQFFDQVFDQGLNQAVGWQSYWTPLRYVMLLKVAFLFDEDLLKKAWGARTDNNNVSSQRVLIEVCSQLLARVDRLPDARSRQLVGDSLKWAIANPAEIQYNANRKDMRLAISPNLVGFQFVMMGVASRLKTRSSKLSLLVVDRQDQFNGAQAQLADFYAKGAGQIFPLGPGMPELDLRHMPTSGLSFQSSYSSAGLELVDIFIWLFKRAGTEVEFDPRIARLLRALIRRGLYDEMSLRGIERRWTPFFQALEEAPLTEEMIAKSQELMKVSEERRLASLVGL